MFFISLNLICYSIIIIDVFINTKLLMKSSQQQFS
jgi:hypothetical protein